MTHNPTPEDNLCGSPPHPDFPDKHDGSFLFWEVRGSANTQYWYYDFLREFRERFKEGISSESAARRFYPLGRISAK